MTTETNTPTIEWAPFRTADHVSETKVIEAADIIERDFLRKQEGYIRRELLKGKANQWVDLIYWSSPENAANAAKAASISKACARYFSLMVGIENTEESISHYRQIKSWR